MRQINCEIESRSDFLTGMYLIVRIADSDLDQNALHTIQADCPEFLLPFNYKSVNGMTEFTYKVGTLCKLQYFYGDVSCEEYIAVWRGLLAPLLECGDWFMNPNSFVLSTDYLYYDKNKKSIAYIYVPLLQGCSDDGAFNEMAIEISKSITVFDPILENKVLRSITNDFNPHDFLKMLTEYLEQHEQQADSSDFFAERESETSDSFFAQENMPLGSVITPQIIKGNGDTQYEKNSEETLTIDNQKKEKDSTGLRILGGRGKKNKDAKQNGYKNTVPIDLSAVTHRKVAEITDDTQETMEIMGGVGLRCIGRPHFPQIIEVNISSGELFSIGRYDTNAGKKQSSFEFDKRTKAVSRRHAAIERSGMIYRIVDLSSSAGTFLNDRKLPPNTPFELEQGCRISFGNLGADYVWEYK